MKPPNTSVYEAMDLADACVPATSRPLKTTVNTELAIPCAPVENARFIPPLNATVCDPQGMEFTQVHAVLSKESENNLNCTLNESIGMDLTEAIPSVPIVQDEGFSGPLPAVSHEVRTSNKTLNGTMVMDFTEAVSSAAQDLASPSAMEGSYETSSDPASHQPKTPNKTLNDSMAMDFTEAIPSAPAPQNSVRSFCTEVSNKTLSDSVTMEFTKVVPCAPIFQENRLLPEVLDPVPDLLETCTSNPRDLSEARNAADFPSNRANITVHDTAGMDFTKVGLTPLQEESKSTLVVPEEGKMPDQVTTQPLSASEIYGPNNEDSLAPSLQPLSASSQQSEDPAVTMIESKEIAPDESGASLPGTGPLPETTSLSDSNSNCARSSAAGSEAMPHETSETLRPSEEQTPSTRPLCRKRSYDEVGNAGGEEELAARRSCLMASPLVQAPTEIVIPSSRSPSPEEDDSTTRFPGLCQSFSAIKTTEANVNPEPNPTSPCENSEQEGPKINLGSSVNGAITSATAEDLNTVEVETPPITEAAPTTASDTPISSASEGVPMDFQTPDEYNFTDISDKTKSASAEKLHKSIMDVSIPSLVDISDTCNDRNLSSRARLYATLLEAENNVAVFHQESVVEVPLDESMRNEEAEKCDGQEGSVFVGQEQREVPSVGRVVGSRESEPSRSPPTLISKDSPDEKRRRISCASPTTAHPETPHRALGAARPLEQILKDHRSEYR